MDTKPITLKTVAGRAALPVSINIHWSRVAGGRAIGYRKTSEEWPGVWWARCRDQGRQHYKNLGDLASVGAARRYDAAITEADTWFAQLSAGVTHGKHTVATATKNYLDALELTNAKKARQNELVAARIIMADTIAHVELGRLRRQDVEAWRARLASTPTVGSKPGLPKAPATVNRCVVLLRAILNRALSDGLVTSAVAWRAALKATPNADRKRTLVLEREERKLLLENSSDQIRPFLRAAMLLPIRIGAVAALTVASFDRTSGSINVGKDKAGADRWIKLPPTTAEFFRQQTVDKLPTAYLFADERGKQWNAYSWNAQLKAAVKAAKLPAECVAYTLRHTGITELIKTGLDLFSIAQLTGTSVTMIEKHYGHLRREQTDKALELLAAWAS